MSVIQYLSECELCNIDLEIREALCPMCLTQKIMKGKWKIVILWLLKDETLRFSEIKRAIPNVTQTYLSSQLKALTMDKMIIRKSYNQVPPKVEYSLTETGKRLITVLNHMDTWGQEYIREYVMPLKMNS